MTGLKPCPCCGGTASLVKSKQFVEPRYYVSCDECLMKTDMAFEPMTAIDTWNNRIPTPRKCCGNCKYAIYRGVYEQYGENVGFCYCDWKEKMINPLLSTPYDPMDGDNCEYWVSCDSTKDGIE